MLSKGSILLIYSILVFTLFMAYKDSIGKYSMLHSNVGIDTNGILIHNSVYPCSTSCTQCILEAHQNLRIKLQTDVVKSS